MTPYLDDGDVRLYHGDAATILATLPAASVQTCVTSPPFFGLRDYGVDGQIGLEASVGEYVERLVAVFEEVRRVLRDDGTCWVELGDSYNSGTNAARQASDAEHGAWALGSSVGHRRFGVATCKTKDLIGVPWTVAFALRDAGWYLRSDIVWSRPNPMPESVTDRPTKAHSYVFLLSKQPRYFYDADAIREAAEYGRGEWANGRGVYDRGTADAERSNALARKTGAKGHTYEGGRNARSVWEIATQPTPEAHFATFPEALARRCILAGSSEAGECAECGTPWQRVSERPERPHVDSADHATNGRRKASGHVSTTRKVGGQYQKWLDANPLQTTGWAAGCACDAPTRPQQVLDPFAGSGTTLLVARKHARHAVGIDLSSEYLEIAARRLSQLSLLGGAA